MLPKNNYGQNNAKITNFCLFQTRIGDIFKKCENDLVQIGVPCIGRCPKCQNICVMPCWGVAAPALAVAASGAQAQAQAPGWFGSLQGWYVLDTEGDSINSFPSGVKAKPDDGWSGKAYLGYRFSNPWDVALGLSGAWLSKGKKGADT